MTPTAVLVTCFHGGYKFDLTFFRTWGRHDLDDIRGWFVFVQMANPIYIYIYIYIYIRPGRDSWSSCADSLVDPFSVCDLFNVMWWQKIHSFGIFTCPCDL
ncbi:hypothetical protein Mapa_004838 [Marchantia paleacea]|nr:hypothetical protein Mapa_004838 [Marchantia paleacea]